MILAKDKSMGLIIEDTVVSVKGGKRKTIDGIHIYFSKMPGPFFSGIHFKNKEFLIFCSLLKETKSDKILKEKRKIFSVISTKFRGEIDYYGGINYNAEKAELIYGTTHKKRIRGVGVDQVKNTHIGNSFTVISVGSDQYVFDETTKFSKKMTSDTPKVSITLVHNAFLKFRSACLRAVAKLEKNGKKV